MNTTQEINGVNDAQGREILEDRSNQLEAPLPKRTSIARVLLAEDDVAMRRLLAQSMRRAGYQVQEAEDGLHTVTFLNSWRANKQNFPDLVVSDIRMPGADGLYILSALRRIAPHVPVILITAFGFDETHVEARRRGAWKVIDKPFAISELLDVMRRALMNRRRVEGDGNGETRLFFDQ